MAHDCLEPVDSCSTCGGAHRTTACNNADKKWCVSCQSDTHLSWDRDCPVFNKKADEFDLRNPDNALPYYPADEPWSWMDAPAPKTRTPPLRAPNPSSNFAPTVQRKSYQTRLGFSGQPQARTDSDPRIHPDRRRNITSPPIMDPSATYIPTPLPRFPSLSPLPLSPPHLPQPSLPPPVPSTAGTGTTDDPLPPTPSNV